MKLLFRLLTLLFFTLATLSANAQAPILTADAAILIDARTGQVLYEKNADKREYPASMTKMMTCILALERGNPLKTIAVSANAANVESTELCGGEWIRLGDLTYQMMLISDNGAATAIAEAIGGNVNHFASMMNEKARAIGAVGTHFVNANGMPDEDDSPRHGEDRAVWPSKQRIPADRFYQKQAGPLRTPEQKSPLHEYQSSPLHL